MARRLLILLLLLQTACSLQTQEINVPTLAVLPTRTLAPLPSLAPTPIPPTLTPVPILNVTEAPTNTSVPTSTPPQATSIAALVGNINVTSAPGITLRSAPSDTANVIAVLPGGTYVSAQQRTTDNQWIGVVTQDGIMGWVKASDVFTLVSLTILPAVGAPTEIAALPSAAVLPSANAP